MPVPAKWGSVIATAAVMVTCCTTSALAGQSGAGQRRGWNWDGRADNGFALGDPWNTPLPADVPLAPNSAALVASIALDRQNTNGLWGEHRHLFDAHISG